MGSRPQSKPFEQEGEKFCENVSIDTAIQVLRCGG